MVGCEVMSRLTGRMDTKTSNNALGQMRCDPVHVRGCLRDCNAWLQPFHGIHVNARALAERNGRPPVPNAADTSLNTPLKVHNRIEVRQKEGAAIRRNAATPSSHFFQSP